MSESQEYNNNQVTPEEMETILMLTRKMEGGGGVDGARVLTSTTPSSSSSPQLVATTQPAVPSISSAPSPEHEQHEVVNKRKRGRPQRALSSAVPLTPSSSSMQRSDMELRNKETFYYDERDSSSEPDSHGSHNIMSIQSMLNNSSNTIPRQESPADEEEEDDDDEEYTEKSWRQSEKKRKQRGEGGIKGSYSNNEYNNSYGNQSWQDTLDKAVKGRQEKDMLEELAAILELPTKNFPHNTARLLYAKLEALKLLRETCNRGLISEELYSEKQQEFLDSMQF